MQLEVENQIYYYQRIIDLKGRAPRNEDDEERNYYLSGPASLQFVRRCQEEA
jgi:hypothetical protein